MTQTQDANDLLMGSGGRSAKFEKHGDTVVGYITRTDTRQQTDFKTREPMVWPDGNPRMQLVVSLQTEDREDEDDDGMRNLYVPIPSQMQKQIADAIRKTGEHGFSVGGKLEVKFVSTDEPKQRGLNGQKQYTARYKAPDQAIMTTQEEPEYLEPDDLPF